MSHNLLLTSIINLSEEMLTAAKNYEWEHFSEMQLQREEMISSCFPLNNNARDIESAHKQLITIVEKDKLLTNLVQAERTKFKGKLNTIINRKRAAITYIQVDNS